MNKKIDNMPILSADVPIKTESEDCFERANFAHNLADLLMRKCDDSIVTAIEAGWGEGKTSVINLIKEYINNHSQDLIIVNFQPWLFRYSKLEELVRSFFYTLMLDLDILHCKKLTEALRKYASYYTKIPFRNSLISLGISGLKIIWTLLRGINISIDALKKDINDQLSKIRRPIIVVIDDIDRLQPDEIRMVFQLLKSICNFPGINYLLAYEKDPVVKSLSYDEIHKGDLYLEKIVQVQYSLPVISKFYMRQFFKQELNNLLKLLEIRFVANEEERLKWLYNEQRIIDLLTKPRDVHRLVNQLKLVVPAIHTEVNLVDIVIFQILILKIPKVAELVGRKSHYFVSLCDPVAYHATLMNEAYKKDNLDPHIGLLKKLNLPNDVEGNALHLLDNLFDLKAKKNRNEISINRDTRNLRVTVSDHFRKLLHGGNNTYSLSAKEAKAFLSFSDERSKIFRDWFDSKFLQRYLFQLSAFVEDAQIDNFDKLFRDLEDFGDQIYSDDTRDMNTGLAGLTIKILNEKLEPKIRFDYVKQIILNTKMLAFSEEILLYYLSRAKMWSEGIYCEEKYSNEKVFFGKEQLIKLKNDWLNKVRDFSKNDNWLEATIKVVSVLFSWGQLSVDNRPYSEVHAYLKEILKEPKQIKAFVHGWWFGIEFAGLEQLIPPELDRLFGECELERAKKMSDYLQAARKLQNEGKLT